MLNSISPRNVVIERLRQDIGEPTENDIRTAVLCGEMGCEDMRQFIENHPVLRCPYADRPDGRERCERLREAYQAAIRCG